MTLGVLIPTFRRNQSLERALRSVFAQSLAARRIVVADNSPEAGARSVVANLQDESPCELVYIHVPEPGVSNARNAGFAALGDLESVAQLDDDESAHEDWLAALTAAAKAHKATVVFGPVEPRAEGAGQVRTAWLQRLYARQPQLEDGLIEKPWGCGNSLINLTFGAMPEPLFDPAANEMGGEDDRLFSILGQNGARFVWAGKARVTEHVEPGRGTWKALFRRAFAFGQGPSQDAVQQDRMAQLMVWMMVGAAQGLVFTLAAPFARLAGPHACAACIDRAVQGLGKLLWFDALAPRFYGASLARRTAQSRIEA